MAPEERDLTLADIFRFIQDTREAEEARHERLRVSMERGFGELRTQFAEMTSSVQDARERVVRLEAGRASDERHDQHLEQRGDVVSGRVWAALGMLGGMAATAIIGMAMKLAEHAQNAPRP